MFFLYVFALVIGGGLLALSLFGDSDHHGHDVHHGGDHGHPAQWLSLRTLIYFLFVFGGVGAVLSKTWHSVAAPLVFLVATTAGIGVGSLASAAFAYLRRTDSGTHESDDSFVGLSGRMTLPIGTGGAGKVMVARADRTFELLARPYDKAVSPPANWKNVIVVSMERGTALVAPLDDPAVQDFVSLNQP